MFKKILVLSALVSVGLSSAYAQIMQQDSANEEQEKSPVFLANYDVEQNEYNDCLSKVANSSAAGYTACVNAEIKRQHQAIEKFYRELLKNEKAQKWNNGTSLTQGTFKDMNDQFVAYRDRLCSLYAVAMMNLYNNIEWGKRECMMDLNKVMLAKLQRLYDEIDAEFSNEDDLGVSESTN
ncbi:MAG: DUF1311 domain-containing protein [Alphaproteobacteria bacterium]|nr:DUF1311 domain-containing protein [Alphaproteobacteria bacterium]